MLRLAGFNSGSGVGARGGCSAGRLASIAALGGRFTPANMVLLRRFAFGSRLLFAAQRQTGRLAVCSVSIPRGSESPLVRSHRPCGYQAYLVHFGIVCFFVAIPTEYGGT